MDIISYPPLLGYETLQSELVKRRHSDESLSSDLDNTPTKTIWPLWKKILVWSLVTLNPLKPVPVRLSNPTDASEVRPFYHAYQDTWGVAKFSEVADGEESLRDPAVPVKYRVIKKVFIYLHNIASYNAFYCIHDDSVVEKPAGFRRNNKDFEIKTQVVNSPKNPNFNNPQLYGIQGVFNFYIAVTDYHNNKTITKLGAWLILPEDDIDKVTTNDVSAIIRDTKYDLLIYLHGVYCNRAKPIWLYGVLRTDFLVIVVDHRGYGDSGSNVDMTEVGIVNDYLQIYDWVIAKNFTNDVYYWGHSLGSALSCHILKALKEQRNAVPKGLVLESAFTNLTEEVENIFLGKIFKWLLYFNATILYPLDYNGFHFYSTSNILTVDCPIMIMHAEDDQVIPSFLGNKLADVATTKRNISKQGNVTFHLFPSEMGYGHDDITRDPLMSQYIREFKDICRNFSLPLP